MCMSAVPLILFILDEYVRENMLKWNVQMVLYPKSNINKAGDTVCL